MFLQWEEKYSVKVKRMDDQHQILFDIINEMSDAIERGNKPESIAGVLESMDSYAKIHFFSEEKIMQDRRYPRVDAHKRYHQHFIEKIQMFRKKLKDDTPDLSREILQFLKAWWVAHILTEDMKYGVFFNELGSA